MASKAISSIDDRSERRDEVFHRTRATPAEGRSLSAVVVNISPHGLMARIDIDLTAGARISIGLPVVGEVEAMVRWSLGGRIGCQLARAIEPVAYARLIAAIGV